VPQIEERLKFLGHVGLGYSRDGTATERLSGGERNASGWRPNLAQTLQVCSTCSTSEHRLHARDNARLITMLEALRDKGNTLLVVEHDER